jgi:hypothetical protein
MLKRSIMLFAAAALLVVGTAASLGQTPPLGLPAGMPPAMAGGPGFGGPPGPPFPPFPMPPFLPLFAAGGMPPSPQAICLEINALRAGYFAYLGQRLDLKPAQAPLWRDVETAVTETTTATRAECTALPTAPEKPVLSQVLSFADRRIAAQRQGLQRISGPLLRLYEGLSPEQREIMDRTVPPPMIL